MDLAACQSLVLHDCYYGSRATIALLGQLASGQPRDSRTMYHVELPFPLPAICVVFRTERTYHLPSVHDTVTG